MKYVKKDCGLHSGLEPGPCRKCALEAEYRRKGYLQYNGTPWVAILGERVKTWKGGR